jgi:hypothetical protein
VPTASHTHTHTNLVLLIEIREVLGLNENPEIKKVGSYHNGSDLYLDWNTSNPD